MTLKRESRYSISLDTMSSTLVLIIIQTLLLASVQGQYDDTRCKCICPDPLAVLGNSSSGESNLQSIKRTLYVNNTVPPLQCTCDSVVLPYISTKISPDILKGKQGEFCPLCTCKFENRNTTIIYVVVIIVIWIVSLLMIYMLFLMCLDPLLNKRIKSTAYQEHTNEDDESDGGGRTSHALRVTSGAALNQTDGPTTSTSSSSGVLNRVGHHQSKWKRQVQEQRRNIYDRHTMLN